MGIIRIAFLVALSFIASCANQDWRHGNYYSDPAVNKKREKERDKRMDRANNFREETAKHYINEHKKKDGKINFFRRDGFDWGF